MSRRLGAEQVLLNTQTEGFFVLNAVGVSVWNLIDGRRSAAAIVHDLLQEFDVAEATLTDDVAELLQHLAAEQLIVWADGRP